MGFYFWAIFVVFFNSRISAQGNFLQICISWTGIRIRIRTKKQLDLDPNPHWKKQLDPDTLKMNADPQSCRWKVYICVGGTVTRRCMPAPTPTPARGSTCWSLTTPTHSGAPRPYTTASTTPDRHPKSSVYRDRCVWLIDLGIENKKII